MLAKNYNFYYIIQYKKYLNDSNNIKYWLFNKILIKHLWFSGRIRAYQAREPGSIPGGCNFLFFKLNFFLIIFYYNNNILFFYSTNKNISFSIKLYSNINIIISLFLIAINVSSTKLIDKNKAKEKNLYKLKVVLNKNEMNIFAFIDINIFSFFHRNIILNIKFLIYL